MSESLLQGTGALLQEFHMVALRTSELCVVCARMLISLGEGSPRRTHPGKEMRACPLSLLSLLLCALSSSHCTLPLF